MRTLKQVKQEKHALLARKAKEIERFWADLRRSPMETNCAFFSLPKEKQDPARAALILLAGRKDEEVSVRTVPELAELRETLEKELGELKIDEGRLVACHPVSCLEADRRVIGVLQFPFRVREGSERMDPEIRRSEFRKAFKAATSGKIAWLKTQDEDDEEFWNLEELSGKMYFPVWMDGEEWTFLHAGPPSSQLSLPLPAEDEHQEPRDPRSIAPDLLRMRQKVLDEFALERIAEAQARLLRTGYMQRDGIAQGFFRSDLDPQIEALCEEENRLYLQGLRPDSLKKEIASEVAEVEARIEEIRRQIRELDYEANRLRDKREAMEIRIIERDLGVRVGDHLVHQATGETVRLEMKYGKLVGLRPNDDLGWWSDIEEEIRRGEWVVQQPEDPALVCEEGMAP